MPRTHGRPGTYTSGGCRCSDCARAYSEYRRQRRLARADLPPDSGEFKPCTVCGEPVFRRGGEEPQEFSTRKTCSIDCRNQLSVQARWDADPHAIGSRTLLALTCRECGLLLPQVRFQRDVRDGTVARVCMRCRWHVDRQQAPAQRIERSNAANAASLRAVNDETRRAARRAGYQWTGPELEMVASRPDLSVRELATLLGRSYAAVVHARKGISRDPRKQRLAGRS